MRARDNRTWCLVRPALAALVLTVAVVACGDDGGGIRDIVSGDQAAQTDTSDGAGGGGAPSTETPVTETPVTETPATETPVTETPATEGGGIDSNADDDETDWNLILLIGGIALAALLVLWLIYSLIAGRHRRHAATEERIARLAGGARWVHDQSSLELVSGSASRERLQAAWMDTRRRVNDLAAEATQMARTAHGDDAMNLQHLSGALTALQAALDTHVELRMQDTGDPNASMVLRESGEAVNYRRHELAEAITALTGRA